MQAIEPFTGTDHHLRPCLHPRLGQRRPQPVGVELLPVIHPQNDYVPVEEDLPLPTLSGALHRHETAQFVQGYIVTDPEILAMIALRDDETIVEVPAALMTHLAKDGLSGDVVNFVPPIVHITENGNYIIKGLRVTDTEALGQMTIPDHETCVEVARSAIVALVGG